MNDKNLYNQHFANLRKIVINEWLLKPTPIYGSINIIFFVSLYVIGLFFVWEVNILLIIVYYYLLTVELWFISHDLIHNQYFKNPKINRFFSLITWNLLIGLSESWWRKKHNVEHHTFTNSDIHDTDIRDYDEIFTKNEGKSKFFDKHKVYLFWIVTSVLYFNLIYLSYKHIFKNKLYIEFLLSISYFFILPFVLFLNYWLTWTLLVLFFVYVMVWVHLAFSFMVNHIGMEIIDWNEVTKYSWFDLQTRTSRNIKWWYIINHIFWWLNKQVEHHIFPGVSRYNILKLSKIVKKYCRDNNIKYHDVTFFASLKEIYRTLKTWETIK